MKSLMRFETAISVSVIIRIVTRRMENNKRERDAAGGNHLEKVWRSFLREITRGADPVRATDNSNLRGVCRWLVHSSEEKSQRERDHRTRARFTDIVRPSRIPARILDSPFDSYLAGTSAAVKTGSNVKFFLLIA